MHGTDQLIHLLCWTGVLTRQYQANGSLEYGSLLQCSICARQDSIVLAAAVANECELCCCTKIDQLQPSLREYISQKTLNHVGNWVADCCLMKRSIAEAIFLLNGTSSCSIPPFQQDVNGFGVQQGCNNNSNMKQLMTVERQVKSARLPSLRHLEGIDCCSALHKDQHLLSRCTALCLMSNRETRSLTTMQQCDEGWACMAGTRMPEQVRQCDSSLYKCEIQL